MSRLNYYTSLSHCLILYFQEIRSQLENCLADGSPLLVSDCDIQKLAKDSRFRHTIQRCADFINGKQRFKVIVSIHYV